MPQPAVSVLIPVYNSAETLPRLLERLEPVLRAETDEFEAILVNDGSRDASWEAVQAAARRYRWVRGVNLMRNYGQHNALLCALRLAQYEVAVTLDDDLQHPPEEIPKLLAKLAEGHDVVYGAPDRQQHGLLRDLASEITKIALSAAMGAQTARQVSAFRALRTPLREAFHVFHGPYVSIDTLLTWGTARFAAVRVRHDARAAGVSNYTLRKLMAHAMNMMTGFSAIPLQITSLLGFSLTAFGLMILVFVVGRYFIEGGSPPGFPFLASVIAIFSGAQLFALGMLGEYLARMHFRLMDKPTYAVRETTDAAVRSREPVR